MTTAQKITVRLSEVKSRLLTISELEGVAFTDEIRTEADTLQGEFKDLEIRHRSAVMAEGEEVAQITGEFPGDGEDAERGRLIREVRMSDYLLPAETERGLEGRARELGAAFKLPELGENGGVLIPTAVLVGPEVRSRHAVETRALAEQVENRAFTQTAANDGSTIQRPILNLVRPMSVLNLLGVSMETASYGQREVPIVTSGSSAAQVKEATAAADAVTLGFDIEVFKPKRASFITDLTHEILASVSDIEQAARRYMGDEMDYHYSNIALNGVAATNSNPQHVAGFLTNIAAPTTAPNTVADYATYGSAHSKSVDGGVYAGMEKEITSVIGQNTYKHSASVYQTGSGESGSEALSRRSKACRASAFIPAEDGTTKIQAAIFHADGPNQGGGMMRKDSCLVSWDATEVIRDRFSIASQGIRLVWIQMWDGRFPLRASAYSRQSFKIAA